VAMEELKEIVIDEFEPFILEDTSAEDGDPSKSSMRVLVNWIEAGKRNRNGRVYPKALLQREVARVQKAVESKSFIGTGDHPASGYPDIATASHIVERVWLDNKGKGWAELKIIPTDRGRNAMTLLREGARIGVSARGWGSVDEKTGVVKDDYRLTGIDLCINPSFENATISTENIFESVSLERARTQSTTTKEELNEGSSFEANDAQEDIMNLEVLKKDHPELVKTIEEEAIKTVAEKLEVAEKERDSLKGQVEELQEKQGELENEIKTLSEKTDGYVDFLRQLITTIGEQPGVLDEQTLENVSDPNTDDTVKEALKKQQKLEKQLEEAQKEIETLKATIEEKEKAKAEEEKQLALQEALKSRLDEELNKDEYRAYADLIRKEPDIVDESGKVVIESVDHVATAVKKAFERLNEARTIDIRKEIASDYGDKGRISDPEGRVSEEEAMKKLKNAYQESVQSGFQGTFEEWKEKFPKLVSFVLGE